MELTTYAITGSILGSIAVGIFVTTRTRGHLAHKVGLVEQSIIDLKQTVGKVQERGIETQSNTKSLKEAVSKIEDKFSVTNASMGAIAVNTEGHAKVTEKLCDNTQDNFHTIDKTLERIDSKLDGFKLQCAKNIK